MCMCLTVVRKSMHCALVCVYAYFCISPVLYPSYNENVTVKHMSFVQEVFVVQNELQWTLLRLKFFIQLFQAVYWLLSTQLCFVQHLTVLLCYVKYTIFLCQMHNVQLIVDDYLCIMCYSVLSVSDISCCIITVNHSVVWVLAMQCSEAQHLLSEIWLSICLAVC